MSLANKESDGNQDDMPTRYEIDNLVSFNSEEEEGMKG